MFNYQPPERKRCADDGYKAAIGSVVVPFSQCLMCKRSIPAGRSGCMTNYSSAKQQQFQGRMCLSHGCSSSGRKFSDTFEICDVLQLRHESDFSAGAELHTTCEYIVSHVQCVQFLFSILSVEGEIAKLRTAPASSFKASHFRRLFRRDPTQAECFSSHLLITAVTEGRPR